MKSTVKIFSVFLTTAFLVPSVGIWINRYACIASGEVQVSIATNQSRNCNAIQQCPAEEPACGPMNCMHTGAWKDSHGKCCMNESRYIKTEDCYCSPVKVEIPGPDTRISIYHKTPVLFPRDQQALEKRVHPPPGELTSGDLLSLHTLLLI